MPVRPPDNPALYPARSNDPPMFLMGVGCHTRCGAAGAEVMAASSTAGETQLASSSSSAALPLSRRSRDALQHASRLSLVFCDRAAGRWSLLLPVSSASLCAHRYAATEVDAFPSTGWIRRGALLIRITLPLLQPSALCLIAGPLPPPHSAAALVPSPCDSSLRDAYPLRCLCFVCSLQIPWHCLSRELA